MLIIIVTCALLVNFILMIMYQRQKRVEPMRVFYSNGFILQKDSPSWMSQVRPIFFYIHYVLAILFLPSLYLLFFLRHDLNFLVIIIGWLSFSQISSLKKKYVSTKNEQ